ncbi:MAG: 6-phosphofructokinase [bacterium]|nr:6-phosphofructokinase [bacterium]
MTILTFTGGGIAPALNPTLFGILTEAKKQGIRVLGGIRGWASLLEGGEIVDLTDIDPTPLRNQGGTLLRSSRTNPFTREGAREQIEKTLKARGIDAIIAIGGDDTLGAAHRVHKEWNFPIVGIPKTVDNDLDGTYWTPGFPSAAQFTAQQVHDIRTHGAYCRSRLFLIEVVGGHAGWVTASAVLGGADAVLIPEVTIPLDTILETIKKRYIANGNFAVIALSKEAHLGEEVQGSANPQPDEYGVVRTEGVAFDFVRVIRDRLGIDAQPILQGNTTQSASPTAIDAATAQALGQKAVTLIVQGELGAAAIIKDATLAISHAPLADLVGRYRGLPENFYDANTLLPTPAFMEYMLPAKIAVSHDTAYENLVALILKK